MVKRSSLLILISLIISAIVVFVVFKPKAQKSVKVAPVNTPSTINAQGPKLTIVGSPDGKMTLTMKEEGNDSVVYSFFTKDEGTGVSKQIFSKTASAGATLTIPFNTFSPDDKYIFLKENSGGKSTFIVPLKGEEVNISKLFADKYKDYVITDVTGWGGMTLIVVNADKIGGGTGPSFWFDVTSKSFTRLTNRFN